MSTIWSQSRMGRRIDMLEPDAASIDFDEIALHLADLYRYVGAASPRISVAAHTLLVAEIIRRERPDAVAHALLHDAHEYIIGDITRPVYAAIDALLPDDSINPVRILKNRHDRVIHEAAGLEMPGPSTKAAIEYADLIALNTERAYAMKAPPERWARAVEDAGAIERPAWWPPSNPADALATAFRRALPVFQRGCD